MTLENDGGTIIAQNAPAPAELAPQISQAPVESQNIVESVKEEVTNVPEKDFLDDYIENNPTIENFASNPSLYAPQQQYQQQPQFQQPQYQQPAQQQFQPIPQPTQPSLDFDNDALQKFIDKDDWAGYGKAIAQKVQENVLNQVSPDKFKEIATQIANQQAKSVYEQQQGVRLLNDIRSGVRNNLSKSGIILDADKQMMVEHYAKTPAVDNWGQIVRDQNNQPMSKLDKAYFEFAYKAQTEGKTVTPFADFSIKFLTQMASKAFEKPKSQAPNNTLIRQTVNEIHAHGQPVITREEGESEVRTKINNMTPAEFEQYKNSRRKI